RLHADDPVESPPAGLVADAERAEREHDDGGVVDVRVEVVLELEGPPTGREPRTANRPVAADPHLLAEQPLAGADERRVIGLPAGRVRPGRDRISERSIAVGRTGRRACTAASATIVCRAQQAKL